MEFLDFVTGTRVKKMDYPEDLNSYLSIHVGTVKVNLTTMMVHKITDFPA